MNGECSGRAVGGVHDHAYVEHVCAFTRSTALIAMRLRYDNVLAEVQGKEAAKRVEQTAEPSAKKARAA